MSEGEGVARGRPVWWDVAKRVVNEVREDQLPLAAAGIGFFGMLALVPALIALLTIFALVADAQYVRDQIEPIVSALPGGASDLVVGQLQSAAELGRGGLTFGLLASVVAVLWSTSTAMRALIAGINRAYDQRETRGFLRIRGLALVLTVGALLVVAVALGAVAALPVILDVLGLPESSRWIVGVARWAGLVVLIGIALAVLYRYAPDRDQQRWRWRSTGTITALSLWLAGSGLFSVYVEGFGRYQGTYGTLAGIVVLLLWLYLSSFSVLFGAEVDAVLQRRSRTGRVGKARPLRVAAEGRTGRTDATSGGRSHRMRSKLLGEGPPRTHVVVLDTGDDVLAEIGRFAEESGVDTASFTAIGAFREVTLGFFDLDEQRYLEIPVAEQVEVLTLAGNIVAGEDGKKLHAHAVVGLRDGTTRGGHLLSAVVRPTLEVMVTESPREVTRRFDESVGLALIDVPDPD